MSWAHRDMSDEERGVLNALRLGQAPTLRIAMLADMPLGRAQKVLKRLRKEKRVHYNVVAKCWEL